MAAIEYTQVLKVGCGIDVHKDNIVATVRSSNSEVGAYTSSLTDFRDWCKKQKVAHVAMESTGVYWKPVFNVLEDDFDVILVNARHVKNVPG
ncbi:MAG: transposase, partial [Xanthomarina gelatinilytica]|uniref:IS110 family transposase n=1 Tax=Xanthomarina gelatinilytica TaxID=1137281 RepID=UPI003A87EA71